VLVSYIIKGILDRRLPWELVILGAMIALTLELAGINSLAFAVGVYLPVSVSMGIFAGGAIRWLVERQEHAGHVNAGRTAEEIAAENDRSPGVLMASGYIAGGSIAGIGIAFMAGVLESADRAITAWSGRFNPFVAGPNANLLSLLPFVVLLLLLWLAARRRILASPGSA
jgi:uncharacterized oligopeptide transporter (OPT) family protein